MAQRFEAVPVTSGGHHFFGYYDIQPFCGNGTRLLALHPPFADREPTRADTCLIGVVELRSGEFLPVAETRAWNFQQGCFAHWHPKAPNHVILYNDRIGDRFVCVELNLASGTRRVLPRPISAIDRDGERAVSLNFNRLAVTRPGYGYSGLPDPFETELHPEDDGLYAMDLETGDTELIVSLAEIAGQYDGPGDISGSKMWFNHTVISDDCRRTTFLSRVIPPGERSWTTSLWTVGLDGGELRRLFGYGLVSHFDWYRSEALLAYARHGDDPTPHFWYQADGGEDCYTIEKERWTRDGHCCYSHDYRWILNDTYPSGEAREQVLMLYHVAERELIEVGRFAAPAQYQGPLRCDLHPRFNRDDTLVCFDSAHTGTRQMYVMDVAGVTKG